MMPGQSLSSPASPVSPNTPHLPPATGILSNSPNSTAPSQPQRGSIAYHQDHSQATPASLTGQHQQSQQQQPQRPREESLGSEDTHSDTAPPTIVAAPSSHSSDDAVPSVVGVGSCHTTSPAAYEREMEEARRPSTLYPNNNSGSSSVENSAGIMYDSVVKPVFAPFKELHAQQQRQLRQHQLPQSQPPPHHYSHPPPPKQPQWASQTAVRTYVDASMMPPPPPLQSMPLHYVAPQTYTMSYVQPHYPAPPVSASYTSTPPYSAYMDSVAVVVPTTTGSATPMNFQPQLYVQQQPSYTQPYPQPFGIDTPAAPSSATEVETELIPYWKTGLFGLNRDPLSSIDAFLCGYCISSAHFNILYREEKGMFAPMAVGLFCVDLCCSTKSLPYIFPWSSLVVHTFVVRRELRRSYGISGNPFIVNSNRNIGNDDASTGGALPARDVTVVGDDDAAQSTEQITAIASAVTSQPDVVAAPDGITPHATTAETPNSVPKTPQSRVVENQITADGGAPIITTRESPTTAEAAETTATTSTPPQPTGSFVVAPTQSRFFMFTGVQDFRWLECGADVLISMCCLPCAMAQHHREMALRGEWPGKIVFSRECFCTEREQAPPPSLPAVSTANML